MAIDASCPNSLALSYKNKFPLSMVFGKVSAIVRMGQRIRPRDRVLFLVKVNLYPAHMKRHWSWQGGEGEANNQDAAGVS